MSFAYSRTITIDHTKCGSTNSTNFPVLVSGTFDGTGGTADLRTTAHGGKVQNGSGFDVGFYGADLQKLNWEVASYNATTGACEFWVQVPLLSASVNTQFYLLYGDSSIVSDQSNKTGTWDSNYKGVWHLSETSGTAVADATGNANAVGTASANTSTLTATGRVGSGFLFSSSGGFVTLAGSVLTSGSTYTLSWWEHITANTNAFPARFILSISGGANFAVLRPNASAAAYYQFIAWGPSPSASPVNQCTSVPVAPASGNGGWHHIVLTGADPSGLAASTLYLDGVAQTTTQSAGAALGAVTQNRIGWDGADNGPDCTMDEVRVSTGIRRGVDWALSEFNNQNSPSTFYAMSAERSTTRLAPKNVLRPRPFAPGIAK